MITVLAIAFRVPIGAIIVSLFAIVWVAAGARTLERKYFAMLLLAAICISLGLIYLSSQFVPRHPQVFHAKPYEIAVVAEVIFILLAVVILRGLNRKDLLLPVISIIVGLHFFGMVPALGSGLYWWIGGAMCLLPIIVISFLPGRWWQLSVGLGCAVVLWTAVICASF